MNLSPASIFQTVAWAALAVVFAGYAIAESSLGAAVVTVLLLTLVAHAWSHVTERVPNDFRDGLASQTSL
jgi:uncharacterized membrane protein YccC